MHEKIEKYFLNEMNSAEENELFRQVSSDTDVRNEFTSMQNTLTLAVSLLGADDKYEASQYLCEFKKRRNRKRAMAIFIGLSKYAAILVLGMLIAMGVFRKQQKMENFAITYQTLTVPTGQRAHLTLPDGTAVWVNAQSTLEFPSFFSGKTRELTLTGEAYFDVVANPEQPFIVKSGNFCTQVTGTQFNVFAYDDFYDVSLIEGQVKVYETGTDRDTIILNKSEKVFLSDGQFVKKLMLNTDEFLWKEGIFSFDNELLVDIIKKLEFFYGIKITVLNPNVMNVRYTGKFNQNDKIEEILRIFQKIKKFKIEKDSDNNIVIK